MIIEPSPVQGLNLRIPTVIPIKEFLKKGVYIRDEGARLDGLDSRKKNFRCRTLVFRFFAMKGRSRVLR